jgi:regulator of sigma E protease
MIMAVLAIILTLVLVVGIHEAGHALVARIFTVKIKRISIGFGKLLIQWQSKRGCEWVWGMWPLGGYVHLANTRINPNESSEFHHCFDKKPIWMRILILLAGACANFITAWIAFILVFYIGLSYIKPQIQSVVPQSIAAKAGILPGDQFIAIAGRNTPSWEEVGREFIILWGSKDIKITLAESSSKKLKEVTLDLSQVHFTGKDRSLLAGLGLNPDLEALKGKKSSSSLMNAISQANQTISHLVYFYLMILKQLFSGVIPFSILLGPLGLFSASIASLTQGFVVFLYFIANLSVAVGLINLFPIPGLDGGSIVYALVEKVRGKPVSIALEVLIYRFMLIGAGLLLVHLLMNDLTHFFQ